MVRAAFLRMKKIYTWQRGVKNLFLIRGSLLRVCRLIKAKYSREFVRSVIVLIWNIEKIRKIQGLKGVCLYLKASTIYIFKYSCKDYLPRNSCTYGPHVSLTRKGIPRILPRYLRERVRKRDWVTIQVVLTILSLYRVLPFEGKLDTTTITSDSVVNIPVPFEKWLLEFSDIYLSQKVKIVDSFNPFFISSSGNSLVKPDDPFTGLFDRFQEELRLKPCMSFVSTLYWFHSLVGLYTRGLLKPAIDILSSYPQTGLSARWLALFKYLFESRKDPRHILGEWYHEFPRVPTWALGRLSLKEEPGKVRIFAIVDIISQWLLKPLHNGIFNFLRKVNTDATFDQYQGLKDFFKRINPGTTIYSFDLSAATDRLPLKLQWMILNQIIPGRGFGSAWARFLTERPYYIGSKKYRIDTQVKYMVGQPMGAYSSWGMLALTHHILVQYAAWQAFRENGWGLSKLRWFDKYCVLGDDIVIGNSLVAKHYYRLMINLGVKINTSKSIVSHNGFAEFAKKVTNGTLDISPLPLKEFSSWGKVSGAFVETLRKFPNLSPHNVMLLLGKGSISSGNRNKLYFISSLLLNSLNPNLTLLDKVLLSSGEEVSEESRAQLKYYLWSRLWDITEEFELWKIQINQVFYKGQYDSLVNRLTRVFQIPFPIQNRLGYLDTTDMFKAILFGATPRALESLEKSLAIRVKSYSEVSLQDLEFVVNLDLKDIIGPSYLLNPSLRVFLKSKTSKDFKASYDQLDKIIKCRVAVSRMFPSSTFSL